ncbi:MAG: autotransporter outer membrane beta-barrel domain-containing protein, partial [Phreatobacter sp.]|nr:autotransporter outer membrane beta-barrel domain-containing protein [Phreatobacter sp.]
ASAALSGQGGANARAVGAALDRTIDASAGAPPSSLDPLLGLYGAPLANAMNGLSGEAATGAQSTAFTGASTFLGIMLDPMAGARGATAAAPGSSLIEMADTGRTPAGRVAAGWSVWTKAFGQAGRTASDAATGAAGTASSPYGVAAGADRLVSPDTLIGFALAGGGSAYGLGDRGTGTGDFAQIGLYGSTRLGEGYVSAALAYGWNRFDVSRSAGLGPVETYRSAPTVHTFGGRIEAGRRFGSRALAATPYAALEAIGASTAGYRESWAAPDTGVFALAYAARTSATARAEAGVRLDSMRTVAPTADLLTFARFAYAWQAGTQRSAEASFQQLANSGFTVFGARASTHTMLASLGAELRLASGARVTASLDGELGDRHRSLRANLGLRQSW